MAFLYFDWDILISSFRNYQVLTGQVRTGKVKTDQVKTYQFLTDQIGTVQVGIGQPVTGLVGTIQIMITKY